MIHRKHALRESHINGSPLKSGIIKTTSILKREYQSFSKVDFVQMLWNLKVEKFTFSRFDQQFRKKW